MLDLVLFIDNIHVELASRQPLAEVLSYSWSYIVDSERVEGLLKN